MPWIGEDLIVVDCMYLRFVADSGTPPSAMGSTVRGTVTVLYCASNSMRTWVSVALTTRPLYPLQVAPSADKLLVVSECGWLGWVGVEGEGGGSWIWISAGVGSSGHVSLECQC